MDRAAPLLEGRSKPRPNEQAYGNWLRTLAEGGLVGQQHLEVATAAAEMARWPCASVHDVYDAACYLSLCVPLAEQDAALTVPQRQALAAKYGDQALHWLVRSDPEGVPQRRSYQDE